MTKPLTIVFTGPESTGKTFLVAYLANHFNASWVPEYLRTFFGENQLILLKNMQKMAKKQQKMLKKQQKQAKKLIFCDTDIVTLKIYHQLYFKVEPKWFDTMYQADLVDHYLLLKPDIPWIDDGQRDMPQKRDEIFDLFEQELQRLQCNYTIVSGSFEQRQQQAIDIVSSLLPSAH